MIHSSGGKRISGITLISFNVTDVISKSDVVFIYYTLLLWCALVAIVVTCGQMVTYNRKYRNKTCRHLSIEV